MHCNCKSPLNGKSRCAIYGGLQYVPCLEVCHTNTGSQVKSLLFLECCKINYIHCKERLCLWVTSLLPLRECLGFNTSEACNYHLSSQKQTKIVSTVIHLPRKSMGQSRRDAHIFGKAFILIIPYKNVLFEQKSLSKQTCDDELYVYK